MLRKHAGLVGTGTKKNPLPRMATDMLAEDTGDYSFSNLDWAGDRVKGNSLLDIL